MPLLLLVSLVWAFSFGLIKGQLAGLDSTAVATLRLALAGLVFLPLFRPARVAWRTGLRLALVGAVQFGLMYLLYQRAYVYLPAYAVVLFTLTTPLYLALLDALATWRGVGAEPGQVTISAAAAAKPPAESTAERAEP